MKLNLKTRLITLPIIFTLLLFFVVSCLIYFQTRELLKNVVGTGLAAVAREKNIEINSLVKRGYQDAKALSSIPLIKDFAADTNIKEQYLNKIKTIYKTYDDITLIDMDGNVLTSSSYTHEGDWASNSWFRKAKQDQAVVMSDVYLMLTPKKEVTSFFAPVKNDQEKMIGVLVLRMPIDKIWEISDNTVLTRSGYVMGFNELGRIIIHPDKSKIFEKAPDNIFGKIEKGDNKYLKITENGQEKLVGYSNILPSSAQDNEENSVKWFIAIIEPSSESLANLNNIVIIQSLMTMLLGLISILIISYLLNARVVSGLSDVYEGTIKISTGNLDYRIPVKSNDEIGRLARTFNDMAEKIKHYNNNLQQLVSDRTKELEETKNNLESINDNLTKSNSVMIGRELRMLELKKEIELFKKSKKDQEKGKRDGKNKKLD